MRAEIPVAVPAAPGRIPVLGHLIPMTRRPVEFIREMSALRGLVKIRLGTEEVYLVTDPALVHEILVPQGAACEKGRLFDNLRTLLGNGLVTSSEPLHMHQRRISQHAFKPAALSSYVPGIGENARRATESWRPGQRVELVDVLDQFTLKTVMNTIFSAELNPRGAEEVTRLLPTVLQSVAANTFVPRFWTRLPTSRNRRFRELSGRIRSVIDEIIASYRLSEPDPEHSGLLSTILTTRDPEDGEGMSDIQARDELITFMITGFVTATSTLAALFYQLNRHPNVEGRLHHELEDALGGRQVSEEDFPHLTYTRNVITETLRLHAPTWFLMRRTTDEMRLGGIDIPVGTELLFAPPALHRDPAVYPDPSAFDPDRWVDRPPHSLPKGAFVPFGNGRRMCIAASFAQTVMLVFVATACARWRLVEDPLIDRSPLYKGAISRFPELPVTVMAR
ncbi:cytochrome P450 [Nocardia sp. BMG51109]|uniref:cytochrome P450 n=1 Tax=Nocardia sp. BMG51109 TaxID=1056816 RepID=UPI00046641EE|nr:cytochrome P450 [Nocardia sp. BMG51109]